MLQRTCNFLTGTFFIICNSRVLLIFHRATPSHARYTWSEKVSQSQVQATTSTNLALGIVRKEQTCRDEYVCCSIYTLPFRAVKLNVDELRSLDIKARTMLTLRRTLYPRSFTEQPYLARSEGERSFLRLHDTVSWVMLEGCQSTSRSTFMYGALLPQYLKLWIVYSQSSTSVCYNNGLTFEFGLNGSICKSPS